MELSELPQPLFSLLRRRHLRRAGLRLVLRARGALKQPRSAAGRKKGRQPVPQPPRRGLTPSPRSPKLPRADTAAAIPHCKHFRFRPSTTFRFLPRHVSQGLSSSAPRRAGGISAAAGPAPLPRGRVVRRGAALRSGASFPSGSDRAATWRAILKFLLCSRHRQTAGRQPEITLCLTKHREINIYISPFSLLGNRRGDVKLFNVRRRPVGYRGVPKCPQTHSSVRSSALRAVQGCVPRCCPELSLLPAEGSAAPAVAAAEAAVAAAAIDLCSLLTSVCAVGKLGLTLSGQKTSNTALPGEEEREETQRGAGRISCRGCQLLHGHTARPHRLHLQRLCGPMAALALLCALVWCVASEAASIPTPRGSCTPVSDRRAFGEQRGM